MAVDGPPEISPEQERWRIRDITAASEPRSKAGDTFYLITLSWWQTWLLYVDEDDDNNTNDGSSSDQPDSVNINNYRRPSPIDNSELISEANSDEYPPGAELRNHLREGTDYILLPEDVWNQLYAWYGGGPTLARKVITCGGPDELSVEVYPLRLHLHLVPKNADSTIRISKKETIGALHQRAREVFRLTSEQVCIWDYYGKQKHALMNDMRKTLDDANIQMENDILVEVVGNIQENGRANNKTTSIVLGNPKSILPTNKGLLRNSNSGSSSHGRESESVYGSSTVTTRGISNGLTGLVNLGNTCFMNSAIQCLVHTPEFARYFRNDYHKEINWQNPLGLVGELALAFGDLLRKLWTPARNPVTPRSFKAKLAKFAPQFSGYNQHDSQELLAFLLDGLHEDLNRVKQRPYIKSKDADGRPDEEVADEYWANHVARNDSIIVDVCQCSGAELVKISEWLASTWHVSYKVILARAPKVGISFVCGFPTYEAKHSLAKCNPCTQNKERTHLVLSKVFNQSCYNSLMDRLFKDGQKIGLLPSIRRVAFKGQYKSTLVCPVCSKVSVTFDPFMYLSLPLQSTLSRSMTVTVFAYNGSALPNTCTVSVPKQGRCKDLTQALSYACSLKHNEKLLLAEVKGHQIERFLEDPSLPLSSINETDHLAAYKIPKVAKNVKYLQIIHRREQQATGSSHRTGGYKQFGIPLVTLISCDENITRGGIYTRVNAILSPMLKSENTGDSENKLPLKLMGENNALIDISVGEDKIVKLFSTSASIKVIIDWSDKLLENYNIDYLENLPLVFKFGSVVKKGRHEPITLYSCLEAFLREEPLVPEDMWYCPQCKEQRQASKKLDLWRLPEVLVIHLKRFSYSRSVKNKLETFVNFPIYNLDLTNYVANKKSARRELYELYALTNHYGGMGSGHYTAHIKLVDEDRWYNFDDNHITPLNEDDVKSAAAYVLFYKRS